MSDENGISVHYRREGPRPGERYDIKGPYFEEPRPHPPAIEGVPRRARLRFNAEWWGHRPPRFYPRNRRQRKKFMREKFSKRTRKRNNLRPTRDQFPCTMEPLERDAYYRKVLQKITR